MKNTTGVWKILVHRSMNAYRGPLDNPFSRQDCPPGIDLEKIACFDFREMRSPWIYKKLGALFIYCPSKVICDPFMHVQSCSPTKRGRKINSALPLRL